MAVSLSLTAVANGWLEYPIDQNAGHVRQISRAACHRFYRPCAICDLGSGNRNGMRQSKHVDGDMALDARHLFVGIVAFLFRTIAVLHALRTDNDEAHRSVPSLFAASLANLIF